jgi:hypothetical protein
MTISSKAGVIDAHRRRRGEIWAALALLGPPSFSTPMLLWAENYVGIGHPERLVLVGVVAWVVGGLALLGLRLTGAPMTFSLAATWCSIYLFVTGGGVVQAMGYVLGTLSALIAIVALSYLLSRRPERATWVIVTLASLLLVVEVLLAWYTSSISLGADNAQPQPPRHRPIHRVDP